MKSKLNLDPKVVDSARQHAANIAHDMQDFIGRVDSFIFRFAIFAGD